MSEESAIDSRDTCDSCDKPWAVRFWWSYTDPERYCLEHLLTPIEGQPGKTLLDYLPDCQHITWRAVPGDPRSTTLPSTAMLQMLLRGVTP